MLDKDLMKRLAVEAERRRAQHREARLAAGLSESAGTGRPDPPLYFVEISPEKEEIDDLLIDADGSEGDEESPFEDATILSRTNELWQQLMSGDPAEAAKRAEDLGESISQLTADLFQDAGFHRVLAECQEQQRIGDQRRQDLIALGQSRLGGLPDLPDSIPWPSADGKLLPFLAQLQLDDIPDSTLPPSRGWMYAFGSDSFVVVRFYDGDKSTLRRAARPRAESLLEDGGGQSVYSPVALRYVAASELSDEDNVACWLCGEVGDRGETAGEMADWQMKDGGDWINFFTITSSGSMQWSDCGDLYLLARRHDLEQGNYDNLLPVVVSS